MDRDRIATPGELEQAFSEFTWNMPGYEMELRTNHGFSAWSREGLEAILRCKVTTRDTYRPDDPTPVVIAHAQLIHLPIPREMLPGLIRHFYQQVVCHEADEWFRYNGVMIYDPHKGR